VLDCGCGPGDLCEYLPDVDYVGIDIDPQYIAEARSRFGDQATFRLGPLGEGTMIEEAHYDLVLAWGVLHHLDDDQAGDFMSLARRCLKPKGRLVTLDPCRIDDQSRVARYFLEKDRGRHVRSLEGWTALVTPMFPSAVFHLRHDLLRIPYTHLIMECSAEES
jgi:SAM-dependent methyltransferase